MLLFCLALTIRCIYKKSSDFFWSENRVDYDWRFVISVLGDQTQTFPDSGSVK